MSSLLTHSSALTPAWAAHAIARRKVLMTLALPFDAPISIECDAGQTIAEIVDNLCAEGLIERAWESALVVWVGDQAVPRMWWERVRPHAGTLVALRALPQDPGSIAAAASWVFTNIIGGWSGIAALALSVGLQLAFTPDPAERSLQQIHSIDSSRNERAPYRTVPCVLGRFRVFPPFAAKPFTRVIGDKVYLHVLLNIGLGPHTLDTDSLAIGDTAFSGFSGLTWQAKLTPSDPMPTLFPYQADEQEGAGLLPRDEDVWYERTTDSDECDEIEIELLHPEGLIRFKDNGSRDGQTVRYRIRYRLHGTSQWKRWNDDVADNNGWLVEQTKQVQEPFRDTYTKTVTRGKYDIAVKRIAAASDGSSNVKTDINWTRLRSFTHAAPVADTNMALFALKVEASDQLNGVIDQINMIVTRLAPKWDSEAEEFGAEGECQNPAELVRWIATGPGVAKPRAAETEIDEAAFGAWAELCESKDWRCDMEIRAGLPLEEAMALVARCGRATLGRRAGKLTPILDTEQPAPTQLFTPRNSWGFRAERRFPPETHAYRCEFNNEAKNYVRDEMVVYFPGYDFNTAELIEARSVVGKTRAVEVYRDAKRAIAEALIRGEVYTFNTDWESLTTARGLRCAVSHYVVAVGRRSARVTARTLNLAGTHVVALVLDEKIEQTLGETYGLKWRRVQGDAISVQTLGVTTTAGVSSTVQLSAVGGVPLASAPAVGDLVTFGDADIETLDCVVANIAFATEFEAEITAVAYVDELFENDGAPEPVWESNVSGEAFPAPPEPLILSYTATPDAIFVAFDFPLGTEHRVLGIETYMKRNGGDDGYKLVATPPADARLATFPPGDAEASYSIKIVSLGERNRRKESEIVTVTSATIDTSNTLNFSPVLSDNMSVKGRSLIKNATLTDLEWDDGAAEWDATTDDHLLTEGGDELIVERGGNLLLESAALDPDASGDPLEWDFEGWDGHAYSAESYVGGATVLAIIPYPDRALVFGMAETPAEDDYWPHITLAWAVGDPENIDAPADGKLRIYEQGVLVWDNDGDPEDAQENDVLQISYDGTEVSYYVSGVLKYRHDIAPDLRFFFDCSLYSDGARLDGASFAAAATSGTVQETRYKRSFGPPAAPVGADPEGWLLVRSDGEAGQGEYSSTATKTLSGALVSDWSAPSLITTPNWRGNYNAATVYYREDAVTYLGGAYRCIVDTTTGHAPSGTQQDNSYWVLISQTGGTPPASPPSTFTATIALPSSSVGVNLYDLAVAAGYTGFGDTALTFEVNSGTTITGRAGAPDGGNAITTGIWASGYTYTNTLRIKNGAIVRGGGGKGGAGGNALSGSSPQVGANGGKGGDAIECLMQLTSITIDSGAIVQGGAGAGGGGKGKVVNTGVFTRSYRGGGGGGGGQPNGPGGAGGAGAQTDGEAGGAATTAAVGLGGDGGNDGRDGGAYGASGQTASSSGQPGAAGYCVRKNGFTIPVTNNGTTAGTIG